jgi:hypothetical protein
MAIGDGIPVEGLNEIVTSFPQALLFRGIVQSSVDRYR